MTAVSIRKEYLVFYVARHDELNGCFKVFLVPPGEAGVGPKKEDKGHFGSIVSSGIGNAFSYRISILFI